LDVTVFVIFATEAVHFHLNFSSFFLLSYSWLVILIILAYMAMVIVILLNVLIAQLSYTYSEAKSNAKLQYAIDRIVIVTRIEYSRFTKFVSFIVTLYSVIHTINFSIQQHFSVAKRTNTSAMDKKSNIRLRFLILESSS